MTKPRRHDDAKMTLGEHLEELRRRIIYALVGLAVAAAVSLLFTFDLLELLRRSYLDVLSQLNIPGNLVILDVTGGITNYLKVALYSGLVLASPWVFYQAWLFVSSGLHPRERRLVLIAAASCSVLFVCGAAFFLLVVAERVLFFLLMMIKWMGADPKITFRSHIAFMTQMTIVFGLAFQTPLLIFLLGALNVVSVATLNRYRRHVIVAILLLAALFTPPDPFSQIALAIPLWLLYELGVLLTYLFVRKRKARRA